MTEYEILDAVADAYNPILLIGSIGILIYSIAQKNSLYSNQTKEFVLIGLVVYGWFYLDKIFGIWSLFNLDYSTHTAAGFSLTFYLFINSKHLRNFVWVFFIAYLILILYQQYHTVLDILTTLLATAPFVVFVFRNRL